MNWTLIVYLIKMWTSLFCIFFLIMCLISWDFLCELGIDCYYFAFSFNDGWDDKCILKWIFICSFCVLCLFVMNIWSLFGNLVISTLESLSKMVMKCLMNYFNDLDFDCLFDQNLKKLVLHFFLIMCLISWDLLCELGINCYYFSSINFCLLSMKNNLGESIKMYLENEI